MKLLLFAAERPFSESAIAYATNLAERLAASVDLLYVAPDEVGRAEGERALAVAEKLFADLAVETHLADGAAIDRLGEEIQRGGYDMVIVGARRGLGFVQRTLASLSQQAVAQAAVPVIVVRHPRPELKRILICTGGQENTEEMINEAADLAQQFGVKAALLYVSGMVPSMYTGLDEIEETLEELLDTDTPLARHLRRGAQILDEHGVDGELQLRHGPVVEGILHEAEVGDYDLIVMGASKAKRSLRGFVLGDVTRQIVDRAPCPVLVIK